MVTDAVRHQVHFLLLEGGRELHLRNGHVLEAIGLAAARAVKMYVLVLVFFFAALFAAEGVLGDSAAIVYLVDETFLLEGAKDAVGSDAVDAGPYLLLNIGMSQGKVLVMEECQHLHASRSYA